MTTANDTSLNIKKQFDSLLMALLPTGAWITCPVCGSEWNKLRMCCYNDGEGVKETFICVSCAEGSLRGLEWVSSAYPCPTLIWTKTRNVVKIEASGMKFEVVCQSHKPYVVTRSLNNSNSEPTYSDNIVSAWIKLREEVKRGEPVELQSAATWPTYRGRKR